MRGGRRGGRGAVCAARGVTPGARGVPRNLAAGGRVPPAHARGVRLEALEGRRLFDASALDLSFGAGGKSRIDVADLADHAAAVHRLADGRLLVAGSATWGMDANAWPIRRAFVARLRADGALDNTFGERGIATYPTPVPADVLPAERAPAVAEASTLAVGADGRIFVGGTTYAGYPYSGTQVILPAQDDPQWAVAAFTPDGAADVSFGDGGLALFDLIAQPPPMLPRAEVPHALAVQADGKLVAVGVGRTEGEYDSQLTTVRFNVDGTLDESFGTKRLPLEGDRTWPAAQAQVAVQGDGKVLVAGRTWQQEAAPDGITGTGNYFGTFVVACYNADGSIDAGFGTDGKVVSPVQRTEADGGRGATIGGFSDLLVQPDGRIVVAGKVGHFEVALLRYTAAGATDHTFGGGTGTTIVRTSYVGGGDMKFDPGTGGLTLAVTGTPTMAAEHHVENDADASNDALGRGSRTYVGRFDGAGALQGHALVPGTPGYPQEIVSAVEVMPDGKVLGIGSTATTPDGGEGIVWLQMSDALVVQIDLAAGAYRGPDSPPADPGTPDPSPTPAPAIDTPTFVGKPLVRGGRVYKFALASSNADALRGTPIVVESPEATPTPAALLNVREKRTRPRAGGGPSVVATAKYRVAAPGGKFDSGDNGTFVIKAGAGGLLNAGTVLGQFQVNSRGKPQTPLGLRRLNVPALASTSATGFLLNDVAAVGGETTGWSIRVDATGELLEIDVAPVRESAAALAGTRVEASGFVTTRRYTERGIVSVLVVTSVRAVP